MLWMYCTALQDLLLSHQPGSSHNVIDNRENISSFEKRNQERNRGDLAS